MAAKSKVEEKKVWERVELGDAIDPSLDEGDQWNDIVSEHAIPPLKIKGIVIPQPTKDQVDEWVKNAHLPDADKILMGEDTYDQLQAAFAKLPLSAYRNFQKLFMSHMFGTDDVETLGK